MKMTARVRGGGVLIFPRFSVKLLLARQRQEEHSETGHREKGRSDRLARRHQHREPTGFDSYFSS